jgi:hypothetical protein
MMIMENSNCEILRQGETLVTTPSMKHVSHKGIRLEACEFERLLRRAMEVLSARERNALLERSRLTNAADLGSAVTP